jgi:hypothetical protein
MPPTRAESFVKTHTRKDGTYLNERTRVLCVCYWSILLIFISYVCDKVHIEFLCILCWRRTREYDTEFIQWSCRNSERVRWHGALDIERRVRVGVGEAWVRGEDSVGWPERNSDTWDVFLILGSLTRGIISGHISGQGLTWQEDGDNGDVATGWERDEWRLGAAHAITRGRPYLYRSIACEPRCSTVSTCKRR